MPLACVWYEERFYTAGPVPQNGAGDLADGKPWVSMSISWNEFTFPTRVTFLVFGLYTNVHLMVGYSHYMHEACSESWLLAHVWL